MTKWYKCGDPMGFTGRIRYDGGEEYIYYPAWPNQDAALIRTQARSKVSRNLRDGWWVEDFELEAVQQGLSVSEGL